MQPRSIERPLYPMRIVLRRTGLSPDLLRAWERRYGVVAPGRSVGGQRLYSEADVVRLSLLRRATLQGHAIGQIAALDDRGLEDLLTDRSPPPVAAPGDSAVARRQIDRAVAAMHEMDAQKLEAALHQGLLALGQVRFIEEILVPFMRQVGDGWHRGEVRIGEEHLASTTTRGIAAGLIALATVDPGGPVIVTATPRGQLHEIGSLLAAAMAAAAGWRPVHLGADLPGEEIGLAALSTGARAVALSVALPAERPRLTDELRAIGRAAERKVAILLGGAGVAGLDADLTSLGAERLGSMTELKARLEKLSPR